MQCTYKKEEINYDEWYSFWMKQIAKNYTISEIERKLGITSNEVKKAVISHFKAIQKTTSMQSNSGARAQSGNCVTAAGDCKIALNGALEIHNLFPEHAKASTQ